ncbi:MAG: ABC transporter ATP-binding protein [Thermoplasmatota archaeon]
MTLQAKGLSKRYGRGRTGTRAVDGADFIARPGEFVLIQGPSGSGKTTLLAMLAGLMTPDAGQLRLSGARLTGQSSAVLANMRRQNVGFVFQDFRLLANLTARENVEVALNLRSIGGRRARRMAVDALSSVDLADRAHLLPDQLSGGEKQRVAIARAIGHRPKVVFADEPTANLDTASGKRAASLLSAFSHRGGTVVVVSHDERLAVFADRIYTMADGRLRPAQEG